MKPEVNGKRMFFQKTRIRFLEKAEKRLPFISLSQAVITIELTHVMYITTRTQPQN